MRKLLISITYFATMFLAGCSLPHLYKVDVKQGNVVTQNMIDQLQPGMNKRQVRYLLGTPMLTDVFHQERWDYIYTDQPGGLPRLQKRIALFFKDEQLAGMQGDFKPEMIDPNGISKKSTTVLVPKREKEQSLYQKFLSLIGLGDETPEQKSTDNSTADSSQSEEEKAE
ncbi:MAG: outer membrane protein assembly factor BamE [Gammaproteobacteria bacterium]|nr:MAG: outer membrane protein assembly factor BamE [Gammaproteobacteria bacterium]RLA20937.1 MAG: outer membrane protein assembly factor BamE [Gammaproteobacteria bacterium]